jgi:hypothetical protein
MNAFRAAAWLGTMVSIAAGGAGAQAQTAATNYGPGRIICRNATSCELGIGTPASLKYRIDPSALAAAERDRLTKRCTAKGAPCVATVTGTEDGNVVKATSVKFHN